MNRSRWKTEIINKMQEANTYKPAFDQPIKALSEILEQRDKAYKEFKSAGGEMVVETISDRGATNFRKNPRLQVWNDLNTQALAFWRDLGLTPAGLKRIDEQSMKKGKTSPLADALKSLG